MDSGLASLCSFAGQLIPLGIGLYILVRYSSLLGRLAGLLTLKPLFTIPFWSGMMSSTISILGVLPDLGLTALLAYLFRALIFAPERNRIARLLIILDCARLIFNLIVYLLTLLPEESCLAQFVTYAGSLGILTFPTAFGI